MPTAPIKALLFDLGGLLINIDFDHTLRTWSAFTPLPFLELKAAFQQDRAYQQHETGEIDAVQYFDHLRAVLKLNASDEQIAAGWNAVLRDEIAETASAIREARERLRLPCYVLTNTNPTHHAVWRQRNAQLMATFERVFVSSEIGLRKPQRAVFDFVAREVGVPPESILFFDDAMENVAGAKAAGVASVHVRGPADVRAALQDLTASKK